MFTVKRTQEKHCHVGGKNPYNNSYLSRFLWVCAQWHCNIDSFLMTYCLSIKTLFFTIQYSLWNQKSERAHTQTFLFQLFSYIIMLQVSSLTLYLTVSYFSFLFLVFDFYLVICPFIDHCVYCIATTIHYK